MFAVKFESVSHSCSEKPVLHNINMTLDENRITIILGKSGSGKSTLLPKINNEDRDRAKQRIKYLMKFVDLDISFLEKYPYQLSWMEKHMPKPPELF